MVSDQPPSGGGPKVTAQYYEAAGVVSVADLEAGRGAGAEEAAYSEAGVTIGSPTGLRGPQTGKQVNGLGEHFLLVF